MDLNDEWKIGRHNHYKICGNGGERVIKVDGNSRSPDGSDHPIKTGYQLSGYYFCRHDCQLNVRNIENIRKLKHLKRLVLI